MHSHDCCHENEHIHEHCHDHKHEHEHEHEHKHCGCHEHDGCGCCHHDGDEEENPKILIIRMIISTVLFAVGFLLPEKFKPYIYIVSFLIAGYDVLISSVKNIFKGRVFDENLLMSIAGIGAFLIGEYPESAAVMILYQVGEALQDKALESSRKSISELMDLRPDYANLVKNGETVRVSPEEVKIGDIIVVNPGERIPVDGVVSDGSSTADYSALTGESRPVELTSGTEVMSGAVNLSSPLWIKASKEYSQSTASKILDLAEHAREKKAKSEKFITIFARIYTPVVVCLAALVIIIPSLITHNWSEWIYKGLVFLAVSCPCALVISVPLGFFSGIGCASENGILIKGSCYLERLCNLDYMVFDKTGTLTEGKFKVLEVETDLDKAAFTELCALGEYYSSHPIAASIKEYCGKELDESRIHDYKEISGKGISAVIDGKEVLLGNQKLIPNAPKANGTVVYASIDGKYAGFIRLGDMPKADSKSAINALKSHGIHTVMLTGDKKETAEAVGNELGLDTVYSELLPQNKVEHMESIIKNKASGKYAAFCGDGINDAPVLAMADIGISMGSIGSDSAVEASDIVLMTDEPSKIPLAVQISKRTMHIIKENIVFSIAVKVLIMILSLFSLANIWMGIFGDVGVALLAVANSMRAKKFHNK